MKYTYIFIICIFTNLISSQEYFSKIIPFEGNPNPKQLIKLEEDKYLIGSINFINDIPSTSLIKYDDNNVSTRYDFIGTPYTRKGLISFENSFYLFGDDYTSENRDIHLSKLTKNFETQFKTNTITPSGRSGSTATILLNSSIYGASVDKISPSPNFNEQATIFKFDTLGNELWQRNYGQDGNLSFIYDLDISLDNNLMVSYSHGFPGGGNGSIKLMKLNENGDILWDFMSEEGLGPGFKICWITQLSDSNFVQIYEIDRRLDQEYLINDWNRSPYRFRWIDRNGNAIKERIEIVHGNNNNTYYSQIETGKGDYFFSYGQYTFDGPATNFIDKTYSALLTKYNNQGDTLWTRKYRHPDYDTLNNRHLIKDIEELDNGDIVILASITPPQQESKIWLYKVDAQGCYKDEPCGDIIITDVEEVILDDKAQALVYPNPVTDKLSVSYTDRLIKEVSIYSMAGKLVYNRYVRTHYHTIDMESFETGLYLMELTDEYGITETIKIVKQ